MEDVQLLLRLVCILDKKAELWEHAPNADQSSTNEETTAVKQPREVCFENVLKVTDQSCIRYANTLNSLYPIPNVCK